MPGMDENAARDVLLVRALETTEASRDLLSDADRQHAGRAAAELARWGSSSSGSPPSADEFLARRAALLLEKLGATHPALVRAGRALAWRPAIAAAVAVAALLFGAVVEQVADRGRVNILAFPLLLIVGWNLVVYVALAVQSLRRLRGSRGGSSRVPAAGAGREALDGRESATRPSSGGWLRDALIRLSQRGVTTGRGALASALRRFGLEWSHAMAPLTRARAAQLLHLGAALVAVGAILGLYLRGLVFEYRIGWESTFLGPAAVHALLSTVLSPAATLLGIPLPSVEDIAALRFPGNGDASRAAEWIHLHAVTVLLAVILPRVLLYLLASLRVRQLGGCVPLDLDGPYFRRLLGPLHHGELRLRVVPYSYTLDEAAAAGLRTVAQRLLGDEAELALASTVGYGDEARAAAGIAPGNRHVPLTLALFNLAATPEVENHGEFLKILRRALGSSALASLAVLVDEGPYRRRLGADAQGGLAAARLEERRAAWRAFAATRGLPLACLDLAAPDLENLEHHLEPAFAGAATIARSQPS